MKGIMKDAVILFVITLIAGALLGGVHEVTKEPIAAAQLAAKVATYKEVYPDAADFAHTDELLKAVEACADETANWGFGKVSVDEAQCALDANGEVIGYLIAATSKEGYGGAIQVSVGITKEGALTGIGFLEINETAGLGMNAEKPSFKNQFKEKTAGIFEVTKLEPTADNQIQAISAATFTSKAVTGAVNAAVYFAENCIE